MIKKKRIHAGRQAILMNRKQEQMEQFDTVGKEMSVSQRQIYILSLLSENPGGYQAEEIRERLKSWDIEVSRRTILRDIDELSLHYGIGEEERNGHTYYFADKYTLKNVDLTIGDLAALAFAKTMLLQYSGFDMGKRAISFIDKMVQQSAEPNRKQFEQLCGHFKQAGAGGGNKDVVDEAVVRNMQTAIDNRNKVEMDYYSFSSDSSMKRVIHPYRLLLIDSYLSVEGYCEVRKELRRFRLSRIRHMQILDDKFEETETLAGGEETFLKLAGSKTEELELLFTGESIRYVKEYEVERAKRLVETEEGLIFSQITAIAPDVIRWIRGFGPEVQVRKPEWLRDKLLEEARQCLDMQ